MRDFIRAGGVFLALAAALVLGLLPGIQGVGALAQLPAGEALVWQVGGTPERPAGLGTLFWHTPDRDPVNLSDVPDEGAGTRVFACGTDPYTRDGEAMMAYIGGEMGGLYRVPLAPGESGELDRIADVSALTCNGNGRAGFSPDGKRWAYIDYGVNATQQLYPAGVLRVLDAVDGSEIVNFENVLAFKLLNNGVYFVQFFNDPQGKADEAVVGWWDGAGIREFQDLAPAENCDWRSAALDVQPGGENVVLSLGERCNEGSQWRVFTFAQNGEATEHVYMPSGGAFLPQSYVNQIYYLPDGEHALATSPQGRAAYIANLSLITLEQNTVTLVTSEVTVDSFPGGKGRHVQFSSNGRYVAYVSSTANNEHAIHRLALDGSYEPVTVSAGARGDIISTFFFRPDGALVFVAGGLDGDNNSLFIMPADSDEPRRVARGRFLRDAGLATNDIALLLEQVPADDDNEDPAVNLVALSFSNGAKTVLVEGRAANAWAYPLAWR